MNLEAITLQDCIDMYEKKGQTVVTSNGEVIGFKGEK